MKPNAKELVPKAFVVVHRGIPRNEVAKSFGLSCLGHQGVGRELAGCGGEQGRDRGRRDGPDKGERRRLGDVARGRATRSITEHATSKALHAIGAVSHLTLTTRKSDTAGTLGTRMRVSAGEMVESATVAHSAGTTVEARDLFFKLPVRRGFLGTVRAETYAGNDENFLPCPPDP